MKTHWLASTLLPKSLLHALKHEDVRGGIPGELALSASEEAQTAIQKLGSRPEGLTEAEASLRLRELGPNAILAEQKHVRLKSLIRAFLNPLALLLLTLAAISFLTGDRRAGFMMSSMVLMGVILRFVQEARADQAAARLKAMIQVTATVLRGGRPREEPLGRVAPGDIVVLAAGDMIPADLRLVSSKDLFIAQATLTGESFPVEKSEKKLDAPPETTLDAHNLCFLGTSVASGTGTGIVVATGLKTYLGGMASAISDQGSETSFDRGLRHFTWLMMAYMGVMIPLVFILNGVTKHDWREAFFFSMAVAVGLTPEMLPMIVSVCLSKGAMMMSEKKVIVKRLNAIQNFGAMDILCTDKTGTLTMDKVVLKRHCNVTGDEDETVLDEAYLNSHFQTSLKNVLDVAILEHGRTNPRVDLSKYVKLDEIPFDFSRKIMSVVVESPEGKIQLLCKGAPEAVYPRCDRFELDDEIFPMDPILIAEVREAYERLSGDGFRVLAVAYKDVERKSAYSKEDEAGMVLRGYLAYLDPPKETAPAALEALHSAGVALKVLTGDNEWVSRKICREVGLESGKVLLGGEIERLNDAELAAAAEGTALFARLSPLDKQRIIKALQARGHVVGYMGDGINDAPALRAADVGISVDTAVDVAKESADLILMEKSLLVLQEGVMQGRRVFANIMKYIRMAASSNFGNIFSFLGASLFLPFVPLTPIQILTNNFLYDVSQIPIPTDEVDEEQIALPRPWSMKDLSRYILLIGPCSSLFDYATFAVMMFIFGCGDPARAGLFRTGWFVESLLSQTLIIHIIRTRRIPFLQSRASLPLVMTTALIVAAGVGLPYSFFGPVLGLEPLPLSYWPILALILAAYGAVTFAVSGYLARRGRI